MARTVSEILNNINLFETLKEQYEAADRLLINEFRGQIESLIKAADERDKSLASYIQETSSRAKGLLDSLPNHAKQYKNAKEYVLTNVFESSVKYMSVDAIQTECDKALDKMKRETKRIRSDFLTARGAVMLNSVADYRNSSFDVIYRSYKEIELYLRQLEKICNHKIVVEYVDGTGKNCKGYVSADIKKAMDGIRTDFKKKRGQLDGTTRSRVHSLLDRVTAFESTALNSRYVPFGRYISVFPVGSHMLGNGVLDGYFESANLTKGIIQKTECIRDCNSMLFAGVAEGYMTSYFKNIIRSLFLSRENNIEICIIDKCKLGMDYADLKDVASKYNLRMLVTESSIHNYLEQLTSKIMNINMGKSKVEREVFIFIDNIDSQVWVSDKESIFSIMRAGNQMGIHVIGSTEARMEQNGRMHLADGLSDKMKGIDVLRLDEFGRCRIKNGFLCFGNT